MGLLDNVIRTAVISVLGAKLAKGRSPIMAALLMLLATKALSKGSAKSSDSPRAAPANDEGGLGSLIDRFRQGGLEDIIKSWIGTGPNKTITPSQLHEALGPHAVEDLSRENGMPKDDLLSQLSRLLPDVVDKLTPQGKLPARDDLLPGPSTPHQFSPGLSSVPSPDGSPACL
jgi:uncharacterized protein YidB (DUF937 family)